MRKLNFDPVIDMGKGWLACSVTAEEADIPVCLVYLETRATRSPWTCGLRLDLAKGILIDAPPARFTKRAVASLVKAARKLQEGTAQEWLCCRPGPVPISILEHVESTLRMGLDKKVQYLEDIVLRVRRSEAKPLIVREVEEMLRSQAFGCYTSKVAKLCGKLIGHEVNHRPEPPKPYPPGSFVTLLVQPEAYAYTTRIKKGETVFAIGGVRGFGDNIFTDETGMKADGTVGSPINTTTARPAMQPEIRDFLWGANVRAMVVLAEILEKKGKEK